MTRRPDWEARLSAFIIENRDRPFVWGQWDCILMACAAVDVMTDEDPAAEYRGRYDDAAGAAQALRELGKGTLLRTVDAVFDLRPAGMARRGDLVWFQKSVGICIGGGGLFVGEERLAEKADVPMHEGLVLIPRAALEKAWTV